MVKVEDAENYRRCTACLSRQQIMKIVLNANGSQNISHYLCYSCFNELERQVVEYKIKN